MKRKRKFDRRDWTAVAILVGIFMGGVAVGHCETYSLPDTTKYVDVWWTHDNPSGEPITFRLYANGTAIWSGSQKITTVERSVFHVENILWVTASDSVPNESGPSASSQLNFLPVVIPPDTVDEYDTFPLVCDRANLESWTRYGNVVTGTYADGGVLLMGKYSTGNVAAISRVVMSEKTRMVKVIVSAKMRLWNDRPEALTFSVDIPELEITLNGRTTWTEYEVGTFQMDQGRNVIQVRSYGTEFIVRSVSLVPIDGDRTAPLAPGVPGVR